MMKSHLIAILAPAVLAAGAARAQTPLPAPLDLKGAIVYALDHNYAIRQAREQIRQQEGVIVQVQAQRIPNVSANGQYQRNDAAVSTSTIRTPVARTACS